jgi:hypothetical protein
LDEWISAGETRAILDPHLMMVNSKIAFQILQETHPKPSMIDVNSLEDPFVSGLTLMDHVDISSCYVEICSKKNTD